MGDRKGTPRASRTVSTINTTATEVLAQDRNRDIVILENRSGVSFRVDFGGTAATSTTGMRLLPGANYVVPPELAPGAISVASESGSSLELWVVP